MTTSTARVLGLLEILQAGGVRTVPELAARLGVDERTVRRYAGHLVELGVPVESLRGRHGGYRIAPGHRMPPLMLTEEEALAVLVGLGTGEEAPPYATAAASAAAKLRRVLPRPLRKRVDALRETADFTAVPRPAALPEAGVLLGLAEAVRERRPVRFAYRDREGRGSERTVLPYGLVAHRERWYVTGADRAAGGVRVFRADRVTGLGVLPGTFAPPPDFDPVATVLDRLARAPWTHDVALRVQGSVDRVRRHFPADLAALAAEGPEGGGPGEHPEGGGGPGWVRVRVRAERLEWIPAVLAALDCPFTVERPAALRDLVAALGRRLAQGAGEPAAGPGEPEGTGSQPDGTGPPERP
ncbi:YafY family protein [Streptomyces sp. NPDC047002]|uniref:helix-turn-helix transcriptional regulator n=1 Tax=Streptomyces sp. NPDC047002 TaxID=3155475 RepID=UPI0034537B4A